MTDSQKSLAAAQSLLISALFAALIAVGALIRIPLPPVPFTLQTLFIYLAAGLLGPKTGFLSPSIYLLIGLLGLPVFSGGGGISYILQPQFGYLLGMPAAGLVMGLLARKFVISRGKTIRKSSGLMIRISLIYAAGTVIIYAFGIAYLIYYTAVIIGQQIDIIHLVWIGSIIFLPTDIIKIAAAAWLTIRLNRLNLIQFQ